MFWLLHRLSFRQRQWKVTGVFSGSVWHKICRQTLNLDILYQIIISIMRQRYLKQDRTFDVHCINLCCRFQAVTRCDRRVILFGRATLNEVKYFGRSADLIITWMKSADVVELYIDYHRCGQGCYYHIDSHLWDSSVLVWKECSAES